MQIQTDLQAAWRTLDEKRLKHLQVFNPSRTIFLCQGCSKATRYKHSHKKSILRFFSMEAENNQHYCTNLIKCLLTSSSSSSVKYLSINLLKKTIPMMMKGNAGAAGLNLQMIRRSKQNT
uniref:Uncharacterized protein n=1 Tax=Clytia hemisphaerica TaxID=252671 RepID=A0A7M5WQP0_9CNID